MTDAQKNTEAFSVSLIFDRVINYAFQQNAIPVVKELLIRNDTIARKDLTIRVTTEPAFAMPTELRLEALPAQAEHRVAPLDLKLSPEFLAGLNEKIAGLLRVEVIENLGGGVPPAVVGTVTESVSLLARNEWCGLVSLPEILAAFVLPNDPAVMPLLGRAAEILGANTGRTSLSGYQQKNRQRAWEEVAAIYKAIGELGLRYISPAASFENTGQKVRFPTDIVGQRFGTCLDLALLFAACCEQAGLHPLVLMHEGHAYAGCWLEERSLPEPSTDDLQQIRKLSTDSLITVFETTVLADPNPGTLADAERLARPHLETKLAFRIALDVHGARVARIHPLPIAGQAAHGPPAATLGRAAARGPGLGSRQFVETVDVDRAEPGKPVSRIDQWKSRLLDLSLRNRLLNLKPTKLTIPLLSAAPEHVEDELAAEVELALQPRPRLMGPDDPRNLEACMRQQKADALADHLRDELKHGRLHSGLETAEHGPRLTDLYRAARNALEENGTNTLFAAVGVLEWRETEHSDRVLRAPLLLVPVVLKRKSALEGFTLRRLDEETRLNVTLMELLRQQFQMEIPGLEPLPEDQSGVDVVRVFRLFREAVRDLPGWEVKPEIWLSQFSFTKFLLWKDLADRLEQLTRNRIVHHLVHEAGQQHLNGPEDIRPDELDERLHPRDTFCPRSADSSQLAAVLAAAAGHDFVLEGPPGTGKSQTISNIIAHCLANRKRVLFVAEKRAALDVVHRRLREEGLEPFCLELHSNKTGKADVLAQFDKSLKFIGGGPPQDWERRATELAKYRTELNGYTRALHRKQPCGLSAYDCLDYLLPRRAEATVRLDAWPALAQTPAETLERAREFASLLQDRSRSLHPLAAHPFALVNCQDWSPAWAERALEGVLGLAALTQAAAKAAQDVRAWLGDVSPGTAREEINQLRSLAQALSASLPVGPAFATTAWSDLAVDLDEWIKLTQERTALRQELSPFLVETAQSPESMPSRVPRKLALEAWPIAVVQRLLASGRELAKLTDAASQAARELHTWLGISGIKASRVQLNHLDSLAQVLLTAQPVGPGFAAADWSELGINLGVWTELTRERIDLREKLIPIIETENPTSKDAPRSALQRIPCEKWSPEVAEQVFDAGPKLSSAIDAVSEASGDLRTWLEDLNITGSRTELLHLWSLAQALVAPQPVGAAFATTPWNDLLVDPDQWIGLTKERTELRQTLSPYLIEPPQSTNSEASQTPRKLALEGWSITATQRTLAAGRELASLTDVARRAAGEFHTWLGNASAKASRAQLSHLRILAHTLLAPQPVGPAFATTDWGELSAELDKWIGLIQEQEEVRERLIPLLESHTSNPEDTPMSPARKLECEAWWPQAAERNFSAGRELLELANAAAAATRDLQALLRLPSTPISRIQLVQQVELVDNLLVPFPVGPDFVSKPWDETAKTLDQLIALVTDRAAVRAKLRANDQIGVSIRDGGYDLSRLLALDLDALQKCWDRASNSWLPTNLLRIQKVRRLLGTARLNHTPPDTQNVGPILQASLRLRSLNSAIDSANPAAKGYVGSLWNNGEPAAEALAQVRKWGERLHGNMVACTGNNVQGLTRLKDLVAGLFARGLSSFDSATPFGDRLVRYREAITKFDDAYNALASTICLKRNDVDRADDHLAAAAALFPNVLGGIRRLREIDANFGTPAVVTQARLGDIWNRGNPDGSALRKARDWGGALHAMMEAYAGGNSAVLDHLRQRLGQHIQAGPSTFVRGTSAGDRLAHYNDSIGRFDEAFALFSAEVGLSTAAFGAAPDHLAAVADVLKTCLHAIARLPEIITALKAATPLAETRIGTIWNNAEPVLQDLNRTRDWGGTLHNSLLLCANGNPSKLNHLRQRLAGLFEQGPAGYARGTPTGDKLIRFQAAMGSFENLFGALNKHLGSNRAHLDTAEDYLAAVSLTLTTFLESANRLRAIDKSLTAAGPTAQECLGTIWNKGKPATETLAKTRDWGATFHARMVACADGNATVLGQLRQRLARHFQAESSAYVSGTPAKSNFTRYSGSIRRLADALAVFGTEIGLDTALLTDSPDYLAAVADALKNCLQALTRLPEIKSKLQTSAIGGDACLGVLWNKAEPAVLDLKQSRAWGESLHSSISSCAAGDPSKLNQLRQRLAALFEQGPAVYAPGTPLGNTFAAFIETSAQFEDAFSKLAAQMGLQRDLVDTAPDHFEAVLGLTERLPAAWPQLRLWCSWQKVRQEASRLGLGPIIAQLESPEGSALDVPAQFERSFRRALLFAVIEQEPLLRDFFGQEHNERIERFRQLDEKLANLTRELICARLAAAIPSDQAPHDVPKAELALLLKELGKKKRHIPVRQLLSRIPTLLPRLKPCVLMSPLSVAQYLEPSHAAFDVVIFDEASQIPVWDAVGAIARGKQLIVVGDPKQLPPTTFFNTTDDPDAEGSDLNLQQDLESILDELLSNGLRHKRLKWHYRSRHESLIAFSNRQYYENDLLTFPSPEAAHGGVTFRHVPNGCYEKGKSRTNVIEARALVGELVRRLREKGGPRRSFGIVTFSQAQQELVENLLDEERRKHPGIESHFGDEPPVDGEPVFVKNLENVQGDERDVILFSVGYGPDEAGRISMNFGPLNRDGGERRLNVAITRAKHEVLVFSSLRAEQIDLTRTRARGVRDFKQFLDFAERGPKALGAGPAAAGKAPQNSEFQQMVAGRIQAAGYQVHHQVGCSGYPIDLGVVHPEFPGRYLLGVECDGAVYHSAATARDRDKLRQSVLEGLGWTLYRIWSTDWWHDSATETTKLLAHIQDILQRELRS